MFLLLIPSVFSQDLPAKRASLSGVITDPSGAVISDVLVVLRVEVTGPERTARANAEGFYTFPGLPAGSYELDVHQPGFKPWQTRVQVDAATSLLVAIKLQLAARNQTVTVTESGFQVDASVTQTGESIGSRALAALPVNGRGYTDLLSLQPGVLPVTSQQPNAVVMSGCTSAPPSGDLNAGNMSVSGQRETANGFVVNGARVEERFNNGTAIIPNLDSIDEFRVLTSNFDAEYGNFSGGQVLVTTKSGTNRIHGSAFEFLRNTTLDARNYFSPERANYDRNQFGGTLGGPIRKDKIFFFGDYQGSRMTQGVETGLISVPSLQERTGNLSSIADSLTGTVSGPYLASQLSRELGYTVQTGEPYYTPGCSSSLHCVLPGGILPRTAWSAPSQNLLQYIPQPNQGSNLFSTSANNLTLRDDKGSARIDAATRWGALSAYYFIDDYAMENPYPTGQGGANVPGFAARSVGRAQLADLGLTKVLNSYTVNELRLSYLRDANNIGQPVGGVGTNLASQGFVVGANTLGIVPLAPQIEGIENVSLNDLTFGVDTTGVVEVNNTYQASDNLSRVMGKHTLRFGAEFHVDQVNINPDAMYNGAFSFTGAETGSDFADFLLGVASNYAQGDSRHLYLRNEYVGVYGQDSWQLRPGLTVNFGARWELLPAWREKYNQLQTFVLGEQSVVYPDAPAGLVFPGDPGIPATLAPTPYNNFSPRLGLAFSPQGRGAGKMVLRAGYGRFYSAFEGLSAGIMDANAPYGYDYDSTGGRPLFASPFVSASTGQSLGQPFPSPIPASGGTVTNPNTSVDWSRYLPITGDPAFYYRNQTPYSESYTLSIERELAPGTLLRFGFVGSQAHHLLVITSANPGNAATCLSVSRPDQVMPGTPVCGPFSEGGIFTKADGQTVQVRGPFSAQFDGISYQKTIGKSSYNALEASLRHSTKALDLMASYTYSKSLDDSSSLSEEVYPSSPTLTRAPSAFDLRHNFVVSYTYKLPGWFNSWTLSGVTRFATGLPVTLYNNNDTSLLGTIPNGVNNNGVDLPNYTPGALRVQTDPRGGQAEFNTSLFSLPSLGQLGTASRRFFSGPGMDNYDLALQKDLRIRDTKTIGLRVEAFNVFNHAQFFGAASVNGNISSAGFGQIISAGAPRLIQVAAKFNF